MCPTAGQPSSPEVKVSHCFQKCTKAVTTRENAIHHLMDDDPFNFHQPSFRSIKSNISFCIDHSTGTGNEEINARLHLHLLGTLP